MSVAGSTVGGVISPSGPPQARDESGVPAGLRGPQLELDRPVPPADGSGEAELGEAELGEVEFVVVDLETTGGWPREGEFASLVTPGTPVPPKISDLTGISDWMLAAAPPLRAVLPGLLEFSRG